MKLYDNNIEMIDAYLNGTMNVDDRTAFERMLSSDMDLKREFQEHKEFVSVLQATCSEANDEFEQALKGISEKDMKTIAADNKARNTQAEEKPRERVVPLRTVYRWMSAAAAVLLVAGVGFHLLQSRQAVNSKYDAIAMTHNFRNLNPESSPIQGVGSISQDRQKKGIKEYNQAIDLLENNETEEAISMLEKLYQSDDTSKKVKDESAVSLAFAYVKNHDIDNAKRIISEVKNEKGDKTPPSLLNLEKALDK